MKNQKFNHAATNFRQETVVFQISFDVKDRRGFTRLKGVTFGRVVEADGKRMASPHFWRISIAVGSGAPNPFDQFFDNTDATRFVLDSLKVLRKMFPSCRFNINVCYRQNNGSELVRYFTGEYFIVAAYDVSTDDMAVYKVNEFRTVSAEYYSVRAAASQEKEQLGNARYAEAFKDPDRTEMSYQRLVASYEQALRWLNNLGFNVSRNLVITDDRPVVHCAFYSTFCHGWDAPDDNWRVFYDACQFSDFGSKDSFLMPGDEGFDIFADSNDAMDSIFLEDEGYFDVDEA